MLLVHRLQTTRAGCEWLLNQWNALGLLLDRNLPWLTPDKRKAVHLLGHRPIDAIDDIDVAEIYVASHVLLNQEGGPFQDILNELEPEQVPVYQHYFKLREYESLAPKDAAAAKEFLYEVVVRECMRLRQKADVLRDLAERLAPYNADLRSWDDTPEGERLRRYELTCKRAWSRTFDLLLKVRTTGVELDLATIESLGRSVPAILVGPNDPPMPHAANVGRPAMFAVEEPDPTFEEPLVPNEANLPGVVAPNEANFAGVVAPNEANFAGVVAPNEANLAGAVAPNEANLVHEAAPNEANLAGAVAPNEANLVQEAAPNEANSHTQSPGHKSRDGHKGFRIDTPQPGGKAGGAHANGKGTIHPALRDALRGQKSTLLDLSPIFGEG
jgi:hypothetical protein